MTRWVLLASVVSALALSYACGAGAAAPTLTRAIPWTGKGVWLKADTHVHTPFSDGGSSPDELVARAKANGAHVIAITDHLDRDLKGATPEYFAAIDAARRANPDMVVITGAEWNVPPYDGDEHIVMLMPEGTEGALTEFKALFDDLDRKPHDPKLTLDALRWLQARAIRNGISPALVYEHPSRRDEQSTGNAADMRAWYAASDLVAVMAGAPGHQGKAPLGAYKYSIATMDGWDPVVARVGDAWDSLLAAGIDVWAAYAPSDFHNADPNDLADLWPGEFSETWVYAPDRTINGVLRALRAGSFFANHGGIAHEVEIGVTTSGLARAATAGEVVTVDAKRPIRVSLRFKTPPAPAKQPGSIELVELIGIDSTGARVLVSRPPAAGDALVHEMTAPTGGIVVRARGFQRRADGSRLAFYTNPVRVVVR